MTTGEVGFDEVPDLAGFGGTAGLLCILVGLGGSGGAIFPARSAEVDDEMGSSSSWLGVGDWTETSIGVATRDFVLPLVPNNELRRDDGGVDDTAAECECLFTMSSALAKHVFITDIIELYCAGLDTIAETGKG